jgi:hypothetical protein
MDIATQCDYCGSYNYLDLETPESPDDFVCYFCGVDL